MIKFIQPIRALIIISFFFLLFLVVSTIPDLSSGLFLKAVYAQDETDQTGASDITDIDDGVSDEILEEGGLTAEERKKIEDEALRKVIGASKIELEGLEQKRKDLIKKEEELKLFEARLESYKQEIQEEIEKLEEIHKQIEASLAKLDEKESEIETQRRLEEEAKIKQLVKVYSEMKPKNAGAILDKMDIELAYKILQIMKGDVAGKILAYVDSAKAAEISERLALNKMNN